MGRGGVGLVPVLQEGDVPQQQRHPHHQHPVLELESKPCEVITLGGEGPFCLTRLLGVNALVSHFNHEKTLEEASSMMKSSRTFASSSPVHGALPTTQRRLPASHQFIGIGGLYLICITTSLLSPRLGQLLYYHHCRMQTVFSVVSLSCVMCIIAAIMKNEVVFSL